MMTEDVERAAAGGTEGGRGGDGDGDEHEERDGGGDGGGDEVPSSSRPTALADAGAALGGVVFRAGNYLEEYFPPHSVDAVLCLSVTKWVQLNWGDEGLKKMFKTVYDSLSPVRLLNPKP
jgi:7SK snRNA methylphosphate capping enzyme